MLSSFPSLVVLPLVVVSNPLPLADVPLADNRLILLNVVVALALALAVFEFDKLSLVRPEAVDAMSWMEMDRVDVDGDVRFSVLFVLLALPPLLLELDGASPAELSLELDDDELMLACLLACSTCC